MRMLLDQVFEQLERADPAGEMILEINLEVFGGGWLHLFDSQPRP